MSDRDAPFQVLSSNEVYRGAVITLRRDRLRMPGGGEAVREVVQNLGAVAVVALDDAERVTLVNQYRHPVGRRLDELPAGLLDIAGEAPLAAAKRELFEEASLRADRWHVLLDLFTSPGFSSEAIRVYLARGLRSVPMQERYAAGDDEESTMTRFAVPLDDAVAAALAGRLTNAIAVAGVLAAATARAGGWDALRPAEAPWPGWRPAAASAAGSATVQQ